MFDRCREMKLRFAGKICFSCSSQVHHGELTTRDKGKIRMRLGVMRWVECIFSRP